VHPSERAGIDVEYESVEVGISTASVNRGIMCGNLSAGVGYFALQEGFVAPRGRFTDIRMFCRSNGKTVGARFATCRDATMRESIPFASASPGAGEVELTFIDPVGTVSPRLCPLGAPALDITCPSGQTVKVSVIDAGALYAFFRARDFGVTGWETAPQLDANTELRSSIEWARKHLAERLSCALQQPVEPRRVKCALIAPALTTPTQTTLAARIMNVERTHKAFAVSGAICTAAAALTAGSIVAETADRIENGIVSIAHPSGTIQVRVVGAADRPDAMIKSATVCRSARVLMRGEAYLGC